jgi:hypothetical protein
MNASYAPNEKFVDMICIGGANDGRRMRVALNNRTTYLQLIVPNGLKAVLHDNYTGRETITYEIYRLTSVQGCDLYIHSSLNPHECMRRLLAHYQRLP